LPRIHSLNATQQGAIYVALCVKVGYEVLKLGGWGRMFGSRKVDALRH